MGAGLKTIFDIGDEDDSSNQTDDLDDPLSEKI